MAADRFETSVFINCPFDDAYQPTFRALVFTVLACGFVPRCALEVADAGEVRIDKICKIIEACKLGLHDISRVELDQASKLPRFNMPFELGLFLGCKRYGNAKQRSKISNVLDAERYRYQKFLSDIAGQDISDHGNDVSNLTRKVRDWPADLPAICAALHLDDASLIFTDLVFVIQEGAR